MRTPAPSSRLLTSLAILVALGCASVAATRTHAQTTTDGVWIQSPPADYRIWTTLAMDPARHRLFAFAGFDGLEPSNDVWMLDLAGPPKWVRLIPTGTPPPRRYLHAAVYDPARDRLLVYGGADYSGGVFTTYDDVWELTLSGTIAWNPLTPLGTPPTPRRRPTLVYEPTGDRLVLFGGYDDLGFFDDTWELALSGTPTWNELAPAGPLPQSRSFHTAILDPARNRMVVMGGSTVSGGKLQGLNDVWTLSLGPSPAWQPLATTGGTTTPREAHTAILDPARDRMVVYGGYDRSTLTGTHLDDLWALSLGTTPTWTLINAAGPRPPAVAGHAAVYDPAVDGMRLLGGWGGVPSSARTEVYTLALAGTPRWQDLIAVPTPPTTGRYAHRAALDGAHARMLVFGGGTAWSPVGLVSLADVWAVDLSGDPAWTPVVAEGSPPPSGMYPGVIHDPVRDRLIVFGGEPNGSASDSVYALTLGATPTWTTLAVAPGPRPSKRSRHATIYDPLRDRLVLFGGYDINTANDLDDVWELPLGTTPVWTRLTPAGIAPERRHDHAALYDPVRDRMLVIGGAAASLPADRADVHALSLSGTPTWSTLAPAPGPVGRRQHTAVYDPTRDRVLLSGGERFDGTTWEVFGDLWSLSLSGTPAWTALDPLGPPEATHSHAAVYDAPSDRMVMYGGYYTLNALWSYRPSATLDAPLGLASGALTLALPAPQPMRSETVLAFTLPRAGRASLRVFDLAGRSVATLVDGARGPGRHAVRWDGRGARGAVPAGVYVVELRQGGERQTRRLVRIP